MLPKFLPKMQVVQIREMPESKKNCGNQIAKIVGERREKI